MAMILILCFLCECSVTDHLGDVDPEFGLPCLPAFSNSADVTKPSQVGLLHLGLQELDSAYFLAANPSQL